MPRSMLLAAAAATLLGVAPATAGAASTRPCPGVDGFTCTRINVPLDRTGTVPGTISLKFATPAGSAGKKKVLLALTGGPGQPGVAFGPSFQSEFKPLLRDHRLVVLDQRGTGGSSALNCPEIQYIDTLSPLYASDTAGCAARLGPPRDSFASIDTADDIEAVRKALGVDKIAIYGVSYGTWVAQQYARAYPTHVERLILDSVVPPGADPWDLRITEALPRVMRNLCLRNACRGITADAFADLTAVVKQIQADGPLQGTIRTATGGRRPVSVSEVDLLYILVASDLNGFLQSRIPAALVAARHGDVAPMLRLRKDAAGPSSGLSEFSGGLFIATTCLDQDLPFSYSDPLDVRVAKSQAALAALPESSFAPFSRAAIDVSSVPEICQQWPDGTFRPESTAPMPDVPTLILSGGVDLRTPLEGAQALAAEIPHPQIVRLAGSGHDVGDTDTTGCVMTAERRFFADRPVGTPCQGKTVAPALALIPPLSLSAVRGVPGVPGARGQVVRAVTQTIGDASTSDNEAYYAGFNSTSGGGLRGGFYDVFAVGNAQGFAFHKLSYVPGVSISGAVGLSGSDAAGHVKVHAPGGLSGTLRYKGTDISGRLGGRAVHTTIITLSRTRLPAAAPASHVSRLRLP
ncbi:MAG: alpha/beta fold hydrolase [Solirubrobacteraceae bacterium]|nr:alpha/beta fold hydrolase [Solirubrobacteraceae bacterium]